MRFITIVWRNLTRRRARTALTVAGMSVAVGAVVALVGVAKSFEASLLSVYRSHGVDVIVTQAGRADRTNSSIDESLGEKLGAIEGVRDVAPSLMDAVSFESLNLYSVVVQGWPADSFMFDELRYSPQSRRPAEGETKVVLLGKILAENLDKGIGDRLEVYEGEEFEVIGVYESYNVFENGAMIVPLAELQRLMGHEGQVTAFQTRVDRQRVGNRESLEALCRQAEAVGRQLAAMPTDDFVETDARIRVTRGMAWMTSAIALLVGAIGMLNTMIMSVFERTKEIGILRAMGWRQGRVARMILLEALGISLVGGVLGVIGAVVMTWLLSKAPTVDGLLDGRIAPSVMLQGMLTALAVGLLGAIYPAFRGGRLLPTEALRHE